MTSHRYKESSLVLYNQNMLDFDQPRSFIVFMQKISLSSLHSIRSISFELQGHPFVQKPSNPSHSSAVDSRSSDLEQWVQMWDIIATMQGLEEVRVRFRSSLHGWMGWKEKDILDPLWKVTRPLKVFDVEARWTTAEMGFETDEKGRERPFKLVEPGRRMRS
jgi:hypothetical protein